MEILFRGKDVNTGEWREGYLILCPYDNTHLIFSGNFELLNPCGCAYWDRVVVIPETVGQYTGLKDQNGKKIFVGDIVKSITKDDYGCNPTERINKVVFHTDCGSFGFPVTFCGEAKSPFEDYINFLWQVDNKEVIGNIHDNPELLKEREG